MPFLEEFIYVPHVQHDRALIAWGGFFIEPIDPAAGRGRLLDDQELASVPGEAGRNGTIGRSSTSFGSAEIRFGKKDEAFGAWKQVPAGQNHAWIDGLDADSKYAYEVRVTRQDGSSRRWAARPREISEVSKDKGGPVELKYDAPSAAEHGHTFRTFPSPDQSTPKFKFAVLGDPGTARLDQFEIGKALAEAVRDDGIRFVLTTGDNIYRKHKGKIDKVLQTVTGRYRSSGNEDDDWFDSYFLPYRYMLARVPVFPVIGNHDTDESEKDDDLGQLIDNFYLAERFPEMIDQWKLGGTRVDSLFYRFQYGRDVDFIALDTCFSEKAHWRWEKNAGEWKAKRRPPLLFPEHKSFLDPILNGDGSSSIWRIPFGHHPPYSVGPTHGYVPLMEDLWTRMDQDPHAMRAWFAGHEHNFQHYDAFDSHIFVTGAAGQADTKTRGAPFPTHLCCHGGTAHFLIVEVDGNTMSVSPFGKDGKLIERRHLPDGTERHPGAPIVVRATL
jgi:tartrate-resistant acid phosphatase type 5